MTQMGPDTTPEEAAAQHKQQAEQEHQRAELAELKAKLAQRGISLND